MGSHVVLCFNPSTDKRNSYAIACFWNPWLARYLDYQLRSTEYYLDRTAYWIKRLDAQ